MSKKEYTCQECHKVVLRYESVQFCSQLCRRNNYRRVLQEKGKGLPQFSRQSYICQDCGITMIRSKPAKFCSLACRNNNYKKRPGPMIGKQHTEATKARLRITNRNKVPPSQVGRVPWNYGIEIFYNRGGKNCSCGKEARVANAERNKGSKSNFWKGGVTPVNKLGRKGIEFKLWREAVFARDNWTCQGCHIRGGLLHPHHIKGYAQFVELRYAIDNGITLCADCHQDEHKVIRLSLRKAK